MPSAVVEWSACFFTAHVDIKAGVRVILLGPRAPLGTRHTLFSNILAINPHHTHTPQEQNLAR